MGKGKPRKVKNPDPECTCNDLKVTTPHPCPYDEEIGEGLLRCYCCEYCSNSCAENI